MAKTEKTVSVQMTEEQAAQFAKFRAEQEKREAEARQANELEKYRRTVDKLIDKAVRKCRKASETLLQTKTEVMDMFKDAIAKFKNRNIESAATEVKDSDFFVVFFVQTVSESCGCGLIYNSFNINSKKK